MPLASTPISIWNGANPITSYLFIVGSDIATAFFTRSVRLFPLSAITGVDIIINTINNIIDFFIRLLLYSLCTLIKPDALVFH